MTESYRLFGAELSPYSVKVRSYLRYKAIPHQWIVRGAATQSEFQSLARLPLIPLLVTPEGETMQDSTPLIEDMERRHPEPALNPPDAPRAFLSALIEEYADEWGNKAMFHYRWSYEADALAAARRIAQAILGPDAREVDLQQAANGVRERMVSRLPFVGSHAGTKSIIESSFRRQLEIAEAHFSFRPYLFGGRPCLADLGFGAQLYELSLDPTPSALMQHFPNTLAYAARIISPIALGPFESWETLSPTLSPLLQEEIARRYLPWARANADAATAGKPNFSVDLGGAAFSQAPQKYHVRSFTEICGKAKAALAETPEIVALLRDLDCFEGLTS